MSREGRKEGKPRHWQLCAPPVVAVRPHVAARRDVKPRGRNRRDDFRVPVGEKHGEALRIALEQWVVGDRVAVVATPLEPTARALYPLQAIRFLHAHSDVST